MGPYDAESYDPDAWKTDYVNPMFETVTKRDAFWAARIITSFSDEDLRAMVETGQYSDPQAVEYLTRILAARRDIVGLTYFDTDLINPLDTFSVSSREGVDMLQWRDLAVARGYVGEETIRYRVSLSTLGGEGQGKGSVPTLAGNGDA